MMKMMSGGTLSMLRRMAVPDRMNSPRVKWGERSIFCIISCSCCVYFISFTFLNYSAKIQKKWGFVKGLWVIVWVI